MGSRRIDQQLWDKLLEAYRNDPGNHSAAARAALVQRKTAKRAWEIGAPDRPWGTKSIKQLLTEESEIARARLQLEHERAELEEDQETLEAERDREAIRQHAIRARKEEAAMVVIARNASIQALAAAASTTAGLKSIMGRIGKEFETIAAGGPLTRKEILDLSNVARRYSATLREIVMSGQMAMEMERLYMGEPTEIIGVTTELDSLPMQELVKMAGYQDGVLKRAAERGLIVLDGGLKKEGS